MSEEAREHLRGVLGRIAAVIRTGGSEEIREPGVLVYFEKRDNVVKAVAMMQVEEERRPGRYKWIAEEVELEGVITIEGRGVNVTCFHNPNKRITTWTVKVSDAFMITVNAYGELKSIWVTQL